MKTRILRIALCLALVLSLLPTAAMAASAPSGYTTDKNGIMAYKVDGTSKIFDIKGYFGGAWKNTTYNSGGYKTYLKAGGNTRALGDADELGLDANVALTFANRGQTLKIKYTVENVTDEAITFSLGTGADVQIGHDDSALITLFADESGFKMVSDSSDDKNSSGEYAQFNFFGDVDSANAASFDFWHGSYSTWNNNKTTVVFYGKAQNQTTNGDSAAAWHWSNIALAAGESVTLSIQIGIGGKGSEDVLDGPFAGVTFNYAYDAYRDPDFPYKGEEMELYNFDYPLLNDGTRKAENAGVWTLTPVGTYGEVKTVNAIASTNLAYVASHVAANYNLTADGLPVYQLKDGDNHVSYGIVVVYSVAGTADDFAVFFGDTHHSGAGYLLTMQETAAPVTVTPDNDVTDDAETDTTVPTVYSVTFVGGDGAEGNVPAQDATAAGGAFVLPTPSLTKTGHSFAGWSDGTNVYAAGDTYIMPAEAVEFTAQWELNMYTVSFESNGGSSVDAETVGHGSAAAKPADPIRRGHSFRGWYADADFTAAYDFATPVTGDITLYAKWQKYSPTATTTHTCESKCEICGGCEDAACEKQPCEDKCLLLSMNFTDVDEDAYYAEAVEYVYHRGMMQGQSDNIFNVSGSVTRGQLVTILWRLEGSPAVTGGESFSDVVSGKYYAEAVQWAAANGITGGYSDGTFRPNASITRQQLATFLFRYAQLKGYDVSVGEDTNILSYEDAFSVGEYAIPAMQWACGAGLIQGSNGNLLPGNTATRAQAAAILMRFCVNVAKI